MSSFHKNIFQKCFFILQLKEKFYNKLTRKSVFFNFKTITDKSLRRSYYFFFFFDKNHLLTTCNTKYTVNSTIFS